MVSQFNFSFMHGEKKTVESTDRTADFFGNIYRFFCWIHRLFINSTDEPVKSTDMSVIIADFKKKEKFAIITDISVDFTGSSVDFTNNL